VTDARHPQFGKSREGGRVCFDHDVHRKRRCFHKTADERLIDHAWGEQAVGTSLCINVGAIERGADQGLVVRLCWFLEEDVGPCIDEHGNACITGGSAGAGNTFRLLIDITQRPIPGKTVFEVATDSSRKRGTVASSWPMVATTARAFFASSSEEEGVRFAHLEELAGERRGPRLVELRAGVEDDGREARAGPDADVNAGVD
jgi:hypothetical protein